MVDKSRPVDPATLHILSVVNRVAAEPELPYILVGATARDLLLFHVFGIPVTRATVDVDFAVAMDSWERFSELRRPCFRAATLEKERWNIASN
jgi:predicted nucleotidyltransferase